MEDDLSARHQLVGDGNLTLLMTARFCIHIGMPKTGTSLVQAVLDDMRGLLAKQGVWTPSSFLVCHRLAVAATPEDDPIRQRADFLDIERAMPLPEALEQLAQAISGFHTAILSSEYFSECSPRLLKSLLGSKGIDVTTAVIVAALRRQDRIIASGFNQDVKALNRTKPVTWSPSVAPRHDWYARLQPWAAEFGKASIKLLVFDRAVAGQHSLTGLLLEACGVRYDGEMVRQCEQQRSAAENRSLPAELLAFKLVANEVTKQGELDWLLEEALARKVGSKPYRLNPETARAIIEHYRESNRRVAREYLGEAGDLFDEQIEEDAMDTLDVSPPTLAMLLAICAAELRRLRGEARNKAAGQRIRKDPA